MTAANARNIETLILRALADAGQAEVAQQAGVTPTRLSRWKSESLDGGGMHLSEVAAVLASLGLCVADTRSTELVCVPRDEYAALHILARKALAAVHP